jgi:hypothetical protein
MPSRRGRSPLVTFHDFLQADWPADRDCYLKFEGAMVSMICGIDPKYKKNIVYGKNGRKYVYIY